MEPRGYYDPPSEREPTAEELEEFFSDKHHDAYVSNATTGQWNNEPITLELLQNTLAEYDAKFKRPDQAYPVGIHITSITPPAQGWPIALYCPICKETTFILSPWANKPEDGDYWKMKDVCGSELLGDMHTIEMTLDRNQMALLKCPISPKSIFGYDPTE